MSVNRQPLFDFFTKVANSDRLQLRLLSQDSKFLLNSCYWHFKLPDSNSHLGKQHRTFKTMNCIKFRKIVYSSPIQQAINFFGARVYISDNQQNIDKSTYALVWQENSDVVSA